MKNELKVAKEIIQNLGKNKKSIQLNKLWSGVCSELSMNSAKNDADKLSDFYISLLEDPDFVKLGSNEWTLKNLYSFDDVKRMASPIFFTEEFEINEDEYQAYLSADEIKELKKQKVVAAGSSDSQHTILLHDESGEVIEEKIVVEDEEEVIEGEE